ncbi:MAG: helix-turn-helix domain-containing protein [Dehalococcoidia bacterium]
MDTNGDDIEARIRANLHARREAAGLSLGQLAERAGVSKAMIAKVESGASSPTASWLGRICAGLGVTLSTLMLEVEGSEVSHWPAPRQPVWRDRRTRLERTLVCPATPQSSVEIARLRLPAGQAVDYDFTPQTVIRQHIVMLSGALEFTIGGSTTRLEPGDGLFSFIDRPTRLAAAGDVPVEYLVIQEPA